MREIDKLAWLHIKNGKLLVVRSTANDTFYIPGGKREPGETDQAALIREMKEELTIHLQPKTIEYAGAFKAQAHGKPEGVMVKMTCYCAEFSGDMTANSEIVEIRWVHYDDRACCSLVTQMIIEKLHSQGMLQSSASIDSVIHNKTATPQKSYQYILFDADNTLFHFDDFRGLLLMFYRFYDIEFTQNQYQEYQAINKPLWVLYERGEITASQLQHERFKIWAEKLAVTTEILNLNFLSAMAEVCSPLNGARKLLSALKSQSKKLCMITNGFTALHETRLNYVGLRHFFDFLVVSEEVGVAKPHPRIFEYALNKLGNPDRETVLMVGDTPASDIQGGNNAGVDTCWLNPEKKLFPRDIQPPKYEIQSLANLETLLLGKRCLMNSGFTASQNTVWVEREWVAAPINSATPFNDQASKL